MTCYPSKSRENPLRTAYLKLKIQKTKFWEKCNKIFCKFVLQIAPFPKAIYRKFARRPWDTKNMQDTTRVYGLFCIFYAASRDRFLVSSVSNRRVVEAVIMHETKGFSHAIRDKTIVQENNRTAKCV